MISELLIEFQIKEFDEHFEKLRKELEKRVVVWASALTLCPRKWFYMLRFPELARANVKGSLILGKLVHAGLQQILTDPCVAQMFSRRDLEFHYLEFEVEVSKTLEVDGREVVISGRADALAWRVGREKVAVIEVKTARSDANLPHPHHIEQLRIYMNMLGFERGILLYITPDRICEYEVYDPLSDKELAKLVKSFLEIEQCPRYDWECQYCIYSVLCPAKRTNRR